MFQLTGTLYGGDFSKCLKFCLRNVKAHVAARAGLFSFHIFLIFHQNPNKKTFTRSQLMDEFWNAESSSNLRAVDVYMAKLRDKFSGCEDFEIVTVHGLGYKAVLK